MSRPEWRTMFERDAVRLAFPDWVLGKDDTVEVSFESSSGGGGCDTCGYGSDPNTIVHVSVERGGSKATKSFEDSAAENFWLDLMRGGQ